MNQIDNGTIHYRDELVTKTNSSLFTIHPYYLLFYSYATAAIILGILTVSHLIMDLGQVLSPAFGKYFL